MVLQSEFHPYYLRTDLLEVRQCSAMTRSVVPWSDCRMLSQLCRKYGMVFTSYGLLNAKDLLVCGAVEMCGWFC